MICQGDGSHDHGDHGHAYRRGKLEVGGANVELPDGDKGRMLYVESDMDDIRVLILAQPAMAEQFLLDYMEAMDRLGGNYRRALDRVLRQVHAASR